MSSPDSRSDPNGGSEPNSGCETIYWDSLPVFFVFCFFKDELVPVGMAKSYNRIKISYTYTKELPPEWCLSKSIHIY